MFRAPSFRNYILISLLVHFLIGGGLLISEHFLPTSPPEKTISIDFIAPEQMRSASNHPKVQRTKEILKHQVVEQNEKSRNEEAPDQARFLSIKNQKVEHQTVAAQRGDFQNLKQLNSHVGTSGHSESHTASTPKSEIAKQLFKGFNSGEAIAQIKEEKTTASHGDSSKSLENNENGGPTSQTNDYIKDIDTGLETVLNTREFKYYSYYNRIRKQLAQHWEGRVRDKLSKLFREGRAPAATNRDRITKLMIVLNEQGTLVRVQVLSDSGIRDLDDAAIEAFRAAAPFPNPPKGIVESDGTVKIRWDFVLET